MSAPTDGDWTIEYSVDMTITGGVHRILSPDKFPVAFVPAWDRPAPGEVDGTDEALANVRILRASKRLYAALEQLLRDIEPMEQAAGVKTASGDAARAALAMARGETT